MLREIKNMAHQDNFSYRRWFQHDHFYILVWYEGLKVKPEHLDRFEISFSDGLCLRYHKVTGLEYFKSDDGGEHPLKNLSPILHRDVQEKNGDKIDVLLEVLQDDLILESELKEFVRTALISRC